MSTPATKAKKPSVSEGRRELRDIIQTSKAMADRRLNPFHVDVGEALETADRYFESWQDIDDLTLDARALNALSRVVKMQEGRLRYQAQLFHADPEALAEKITKFKTEQLGKIFLGAWHPCVEQEQLTSAALEEAIEYWNELEPVALRRRERPRRAPPALEELSLDDLLAKGIVPRDSFGTQITELWADLQARGPTPYLDFIDGGGDRATKVKRAYATSYLVTYGYAHLAQDNGALVLHPRSEREPPSESVSLPIIVTV